MRIAPRLFSSFLGPGCWIILAAGMAPAYPGNPPTPRKAALPEGFEYILPHTPSAAGKETFITIINPDATRLASLTVQGWDEDGALVEEIAFALPPSNKLRAGLEAWFSARAQEVAWIGIRSDLTLLVLAELAGERTSAAYMASPGQSPTLFLPHIAKNTARFATFLAAVDGNRSAMPSQLVAEPEGVAYPLPGSGNDVTRIHRDMREIFGEDLSAIDWARLEGSKVAGEKGLAAMEYFTVLPQRAQIAALGLGNRQGHNLRFPHIARDVGQFWTGLVYINLGETAADVVETYYDEQGSPLLSRQRRLAAGAKVDPIPLFDRNQHQPNGASWMEVSSDQPLLGYELFGAPLESGHDYFAGLQGSYQASRIIDFPHVFYGENAFTGLVAVNVGEAPADLIFTAFAADGSVVARSEPLSVVAAKAKIVRLARDLFTPQDLIRAAWIRAASPSPSWTGFLLWGDTAPPRQKLAAIKAIGDSGENLPIVLDEVFADWDTRAPIYRDATDDAGGGAEDFGALWIENDDRYLFLGFETGAELLLQSGNSVQLLLDTDGRRLTGTPAHGLGAELEFRFGEGAGTVVLGGQSFSIGPYDLQLVSSPTVSSRRFELAIRRDLQFGGMPLFGADLIQVLLRSGAPDFLPDETGGLTYAFKRAPPSYPPSFSIAKRDPDHLRLLSYNVEVDSLFDPALLANYSRILKALQPDIIGFQEILFHNSQQTADLVEQILPSGPEETWFHASDPNSDVVAISRFPIEAGFSIQGNSAFLLDLRPNYDSDLLFLVAHTPCCEDDRGRQAEIDAFMAFIREAKNPGGALTLSPGTPILVAGDMNLVGFARQQRTLLSGDIADEAAFGPDFTPDWNGDRFADAKPPTTGLPTAFTWFSEDSQFSPGRLDYVVYTASVLSKSNAYALFSRGLTAQDLAAHGLQADDTVLASDHLPLIVDFQWRPLDGSLPKTAAKTRGMTVKQGQ